MFFSTFIEDRLSNDQKPTQKYELENEITSHQRM